MEQEYNINITKSAFEQINLIKKNDYTLEADFFRLSIDGKGCSGFTYALGFSERTEKDLCLELSINDQNIFFLMDPFAAFYCKEGRIDYLRNDQTGEEGFIFINANEKKHQGKFFKDETKTPGEL